MGYRQYIGARYVPLPDGTWNATKDYEPLIIVDDGNGNSYLSKKNVPAGTPLSNREYWMQAFNFSGSLIDLQRRVGDAEVEIDGLQSDVTALQSDVADIEQQIIEQASGIRRVVCITDSYGTSSGNWMEYLKGYLNITTPTDFYMYAEGQTGFEHAGHQNHTFKGLLELANAAVTNKGTIDAIVIGGGTNDFAYYTNENNFNAAIAETVQYAKQNFPKAKIYLAFMGYYTYPTLAIKENVYKVMAAYKGEGAKNGALYINASTPMHILDNRLDGMHPNAKGGAAIANCIYNVLKGGENAPTCSGYESAASYSIPLTEPPNVTKLSDDEGNITVGVRGDTTVLRFGLIQRSYTDIQVGGPNIANIGMIDIASYPYLSQNYYSFAVNATVQTPNGESAETAAMIYILRSTVDTDQWAVMRATFPNLSSRQMRALRIPAFSITVPTVDF